MTGARSVVQRMIGRVGDGRATSWKPAATNAEASPVQANTSGIVSCFGCCG